MAIRSLCSYNKKELKKLSDDFGLLHRQDVQKIIENCKSYAEGQ